MNKHALLITIGWLATLQVSAAAIADTIPGKNLNRDTVGKYILGVVEKDAEYPGGSEAWKKFLESNLNLDVVAKSSAKPGTYVVVVQFIVNTEGYVDGVKALTRHGYGMEEEAVRVIKKSARWEPAIQNGRYVKAYRKQPITIQVCEVPKEKKKRGFFSWQ